VKFAIATGALFLFAALLTSGAHAQIYSLTKDQIASITRNCAAYPEARRLREEIVSSVDRRLLEGSDEYLVDFIIHPRSKRSLFVHSGDITYGDPEAGGGRYQFRNSVDLFEKWKLTSAATGRPFPNADFPESGPATAPWDEQGWLDTREMVNGEPNPTYGERYYWHAHYAFWFWHQLPDLILSTVTAHLVAAEDDPRKAEAGRAAAILLLRVAHAFPETRVEDFRSYDWVQEVGNVGRLMDDIWEPNLSRKLGWAYDLLRDYIREDESLLAIDFTRDGTAFGDDSASDLNGDGQTTTEDLLQAVEDKLLRPYAKIWREKPLNRANATLFQQRALAAMAVFLQDRDLFEYCRKSLLDYVGPNWYFNDGGYYEGSIGGYGRHCVVALRAAVDWLRRFEPELEAPRVVQGHIFNNEMLIQRTWLPNNDDAAGPVLQCADEVEHGPAAMPMLWEDDQPEGPRFTSVQHLWTNWDEPEHEHLAEAINGDGPGTTLKRAGYAALRTGPAEQVFDLVATFDPHGGSHTHYDHLGLALYGFGCALTPEIGYPDNLQSPARRQWVNHTLSHWSVTVDRSRGNRLFPRGELRLFHSEPGVQIFRGEAPNRYEGVGLYNRTVVLLDTPSGGALVLDRLEVRGGREHLYSFHGAAHDGANSVTADGASIEAVSPYETLMGHWADKPIPYGKPGGEAEEGSIGYLEKVRPLTLGDGAFRLSFPRGDGKGTTLDLWMTTENLRDAYLCEGRTQPTVNKGNVQLPYAVARAGGMDRDEQQHTVFWAVVEARQTEAWVQSVEESEGTLTVRGKDGQTISLRVDAEGATLERADLRRRVERAAVGTVKSVDPRRRALDLGGVSDLSPGEWLLFENDLGKSTFYPVERVEADGQIIIGDQWTSLTVAHPVLTGEADGKRMLRNEEIVVQYPMARLAVGGAVQTSRGWKRVEAVEGDAVRLEASPAECAAFARKAAENGGGIDIVDIAPGDRVTRFTASTLEE
jgi:hypothetical protein